MQRGRNDPPQICEVKPVLSRSFPPLLWISAMRRVNSVVYVVKWKCARVTDFFLAPASTEIGREAPLPLCDRCAADAAAILPQKLRVARTRQTCSILETTRQSGAQICAGRRPARNPLVTLHGLCLSRTNRNVSGGCFWGIATAAARIRAAHQPPHQSRGHENQTWACSTTVSAGDS